MTLLTGSSIFPEVNWAICTISKRFNWAGTSGSIAYVSTTFLHTLLYNDPYFVHSYLKINGRSEQWHFGVFLILLLVFAGFMQCRYASWQCRPPHLFFFSTIWVYLAVFSLAARPTLAHKSSLVSPQCLPAPSWNSQLYVSPLDNMQPTETLYKALIFPQKSKCL